MQISDAIDFGGCFQTLFRKCTALTVYKTEPKENSLLPNTQTIFALLENSHPKIGFYLGWKSCIMAEEKVPNINILSQYLKKTAQL